MATAFRTPPITVPQYKPFPGFPGIDELIYGEIVPSPQPKPLHQRVVLMLLHSLPKDQEFTPETNSNIDFGVECSMPAPDVFVVAQSECNRACDQDDDVRTPPVQAPTRLNLLRSA